MRGLYVLLLSVMACLHVDAQSMPRILSGADMFVEVSGTASSGEFAPLWLSANRYGMVSPYANSAYERVGMERSLDNDSLRKWKIGYGIDLTLNQNAPAKFFVHQAYAQLKYKKVTLTIGSKEREIDLRNNNLTSGGLSHGINARPIPMAMLDIDYFRITNWWQIKLRCGYGMTTDGAWQKRWVDDPQRTPYTSNVLFHDKAAYFKFTFARNLPLSLEIGAQFKSKFGGTSYNVSGRGIIADKVEHDSGPKAFLHALIPIGGSDVTDGTQKNAEGNIIGSYNARLKYRGFSLYYEHMFEDHSQMFMQYPWYDHLVGFDVELPRNRFVSHALVEHMSTKDQSGAVYHDPTHNMPDNIFGNDNYYNHALFSGWQHWGLGIGNPLLLSPIYNKEHRIQFQSTRTQAWHVGLDGQPTDEIVWKLLATWTRDWGTYDYPYDEIVKQQHYLLGVTYMPHWAKGWKANLDCAYSKSDVIGNTFGVQLTVRKEFRL